MIKKLKGSGLSDILIAFKKINMILFISLSDLNARYKNSILGPLWISIGTGIFVFGIGFLWSEILNKEPSNFLPSLSVGIIFWQFISSCLSDSTTIYTNKISLIKNIKLPLFMFPLQVLLRQIINFGHNAIILIIILFFFEVNLNIEFLLCFPFFLIFIFNMLWIALVMSIIGARFKDFHFVVVSILPIIFFITPVLYQLPDIGLFSKLLLLNPFTHLIEMIRNPLIGNVLNLFSVYFSIIFLLVGWIFTILFFNRTRDRIIFWI